VAGTAAEQRLQRITKLDKKTASIMSEGIGHESALARSLADAMAQTVADRLRMADDFLAMAEVLMRSRHDMARPAIARYYYAMYHAMRAAAYQHHKGDDFESHSALSSKGVPPDYPHSAVASNDLRNARLLRNEADYDQYPADNKYFKTQARSLRPVAIQFVAIARQYVTTKGNPYS
jgi:uncharacterized protein (UPF0332 family)